MYCQRRKSLAGVCADIHKSSLEKRHKRTVGSRVNAHLEHLFLAFENNGVKRNADRSIL